MRLQMNFIRHGRTQGNLERRYVGATDEDLCEVGREEIATNVENGLYPAVGTVFVSPMRRCKQTAAIIYPDKNPQIMLGLAETDFGMFEYKNYEELKDNEIYQQWIDSNGKMSVPGAESTGHFKHRLRNAFVKMMQTCEEQKVESATCIVHGGVIMELMDAFGAPKRDFYDWQVKNGCGLAAEVEIEDGNFIIRFDHWICP